MAARVWNGAKNLERYLVPVNHLERHPQNPRRGLVSEISKSLERFGQTRPILTDGRRIIAGNHTYLAAREIGWTHIAAVANQFASEEEAKAYLLADNRLPELGEYDRGQLVALLEELEAAGAWDGTGYDSDYLEDTRAALALVPTTAPEAFAGGYAATPEELAARAEQLAGGRTFDEVVLLPTVDQHAQFSVDVKMLSKEYGKDGVTAVVVEAVRHQAELLSK